MLSLVALVLPLCLDTFAISAAIGMADSAASRAQRLRLGLLFAAFEGGAPLVGLLAGAGLGRVLGGVADYLAIAALATLGGYMLLAGDEAEEERARLLARTHGAAVIGIGLSASLDELAIGFTLGLLRAPVLPAVLLIAAQAFIVSQVGLRVGAHVGERVREGAERLAALVLIALAALLLIARFAHVSL